MTQNTTTFIQKINDDRRQQCLPPCDITINNNKASHGALRDVAHTLYKGVLYCQNTIRFNGARRDATALRAITKSAAFPTPK